VLWGQGAAEALNTRPVKIQQLPAPKEKDIKHATKVWWVGWCFL
jgi:hypothetical protein